MALKAIVCHFNKCWNVVCN